MSSCPFCEIASGESRGDLVLRTQSVFVVPALKQRRLNLGHMLVLPVSHVTRLLDVDLPLLQELYSIAGRVSMALRQAFSATGATLFQNDNAPDQHLSHLHIHVVPRHEGDGFRMPDPRIEEVPYEERRAQAAALRGILDATG